MKYRQVLLMNLLAIFGLSIISGCSVSGPKNFEYPEIPPDFPFTVMWLRPKEEAARIPPHEFKQLELLQLVMVRKWNEGNHDFVGAGMNDGKIYLHYPNVVYVKWEDSRKPDGTIIKYASEISGPGGDSTIVDQVREGILPPGVQVLDMDSSGIDPYEYLIK